MGSGRHELSHPIISQHLSITVTGRALQGSLPTGSIFTLYTTTLVSAEGPCIDDLLMIFATEWTVLVRQITTLFWSTFSTNAS